MKAFALSAALALSSMVAVPAWADEAVTYLFPAPDTLVAFAPFQLAKGKGYFKAEGLDVTFRVGKGGADVAAQVAANNADLGGGIGDTPIILRPNGVNVKGVALLGGHGLTQMGWRTDRGITGPQDLKGKRIGVLSFQDTTYYNLLGLLGSVGLTKDDVSIQAVGPGGIVQLLISGDLDAFCGAPEYLPAVEAAGVDLDMVPVDSVFPAMAQAIIASDKTVAEKPQMVAGVVRAVLKAVKEIEADPKAAAAEYVKFVPQQADKLALVEATMQEYATRVYPAQDGQPLGSFDEARLKAVQDFYVKSGIVASATPIADTYTNEFVK